MTTIDVTPAINSEIQAVNQAEKENGRRAMGIVRRWGDKGENRRERKYFSAEFQLENPWVYYKFRLRHTDQEPMFVLVKKGSQALDCLVPGQRLCMTFHFEDNDIPPEQREVTVKSMENAFSAGMAGHVMVAFSL